MQDTYDPQQLEFSLVGSSKSGKSKMITRFIKNDFHHSNQPTCTIDFKRKTFTIARTEVKLTIWDTTGVMDNLLLDQVTKYLKQSHVFLLCFSVTDQTSFEEIEVYYNKMKELNPTADMFQIGLKCDLDDTERVVSVLEANDMAKKLGGLKYMECSAKDGSNVDEVFTKIGEIMLRKLYDNTPDQKSAKKERAKYNFEVSNSFEKKSDEPGHRMIYPVTKGWFKNIFGGCCAIRDR